MNNQPPALSSAPWGSRTKRLVVLACVALVAFLLLNLLEIFPIIIISALISYLLWPLMLFFERRLLTPVRLNYRSLAVLLTFIAVIALFVFIVLIIVPTLVGELASIGRRLPETFGSIERSIEAALNRPLMLLGLTPTIDGEPIIPLEQLREIMGTQEGQTLLQAENLDIAGAVRGILGSIGSLTGPAFSVLGGFFTTVFNLVFLLTIVFYLLRDGDKFAHQIVQAAPPSYRGDTARMLYELGQVWNAYLRGQIILGVTIGLMVYAAAVILGVPNAPILGLLAGLLEFIPNIGPFIALVPAFFLALFSQSATLPFLEGPLFAVVVAVTWTGIQNIEAFYVVPRVMGGSLDLHPVIVIMAVIAGASVAGPLGIILAAPFTATIRLIALYILGKLFDRDPFPQKSVRAAPPSLPTVRLAHWRDGLPLRGVVLPAFVRRRLPARLAGRLGSIMPGEATAVLSQTEPAAKG